MTISAVATSGDRDQSPGETGDEGIYATVRSGVCDIPVLHDITYATEQQPLYIISLSFSLFFWPSHVACGILVPQPGIKPNH